LSAQVQTDPVHSSDTASRPIPRIGLSEALRALLAAGGLRRDMLSGMLRQHERHGPVVAQMGREARFVNLFGPDANRFVLVDPERIFSARIPWMGIMGRIFPNGLLLLDGHEHQSDRRLMHGAFARSAIDGYAERMSPMIETSLREWPAQGAGVRVFKRFKQLTLDIATRIFIGVEPGASARPMNRAFSDMVAASMSRIRLPIRGLEFRRGLDGRQFMLRFLGQLLADKRAGTQTDMLSRLCRARDPEGEAFTDQRIMDHMIFLMMAAHDTTTSTLTSMAYELARHPEWQERARAESRALGKPYADAEDVERLPSLTWIMREALRRYPPLPIIPRVATRDFDWSGYTIRAGAMVVVSPIHSHHMSEWWTDPFRFDPERFCPERAEDQRHSHSWIPFGAGPHVCLGKRFAEIQIRSVMHQMLLRWRWSVPDTYRMPVQQAPISKPVDGLPITLERI
jgi:cytochrome P450